MLCNASLAAGDACTHTAAVAAERVPGADVIVDGDHEDGGIALGEYLCWNKQISRRRYRAMCGALNVWLSSTQLFVRNSLKLFETLVWVTPFIVP